MRHQVRYRVAGALVGAVAIAVATASCGTSSTVTETADPTVGGPATAATTVAESPESGSTEESAQVVEPTVPPAPDDEANAAPPQGGGCVLTRDLVAAAVGEEIVDTGIWSSSSSYTGLSVGGCSYETGSGGRYFVGVATGLDGSEGSAPAVFDGLLARGELNASVTSLGDGAFFSDETLFVADGDEAWAVEVIGASLEPNDFDLLRELAASILALDGLEARCDALAGLIPDVWQPGADVLRGGGSSDGPTGSFTFDLCEVQIAAGAGATVSLRSGDDPAWFDAEREGARDFVTLVESLGTAAVHLDDDLILRVGERVVVVKGQDSEGESLDVGISEALADLARTVVIAAG